MPDMDAAVALDPVLRSFRDAVAELYGPVLDRVVLFGSRARGDAREDSDYDVAKLQSRFLSEGGPYFETIPFAASDYEKRTPLMHEIRKDGLTL